MPMPIKATVPYRGQTFRASSSPFVDQDIFYFISHAPGKVKKGNISRI